MVSNALLMLPSPPTLVSYTNFFIIYLEKTLINEIWPTGAEMPPCMLPITMALSWHIFRAITNASQLGRRDVTECKWATRTPSISILNYNSISARIFNQVYIAL